MTHLTCMWDLDVTDCCTLPDNADNLALVESAVSQASIMMTRFSGYQIGLCDATLRPLSECRSCRTWCCGGADGIRLVGPLGMTVHTVEAVHNGDVDVDETTWEWDRAEQTLWRVPPDRWPKRDTRWAECGTDEAFCVDVTVGSPPDAWAVAVGTELACEILKNCTGQPCRLPKNATNVSGQGVTVSLNTEEIRYYLPSVAAWVDVVNPNKASVPARIYTPDHRHGR